MNFTPPPPTIRLLVLLSVALVGGAVACSSPGSPAPRVTETHLGLGFAQTSVNSPIFRHSPLYTHDGTQFAAWYDGEGVMTLAKRPVGGDAWEVSKTQYTGNVRDAHNVISLAVDGDGYLHVAWDHHGHPLNYAIGIEPGSLELSEKRPMTGQNESHLTYPQFYAADDGGLVFLFRDGGSGNGNLVLNRYDIADRQWNQVHPNLVSGEGQRNAYWQACTDDAGTLHLSWVWRETGDVATNHDICYARSPDGGVSWEKSDGTSYNLPITQATAEVAWEILQNSDLMNQTSMFADADGRPYIANYWRPPGGHAPQYHIVYRDGDRWALQQVMNRTSDFTLGGGGTKRVPISRPLIVSATDAGRTSAWLVFRDEDRSSKVSVAICDDLSEPDWRVVDLTEDSVGHWEPTYDPAAWRERGVLSLFVQRMGQGDGETAIELPPQPVRVLDVANDE